MLRYTLLLDCVVLYLQINCLVPGESFYRMHYTIPEKKPNQVLDLGYKQAHRLLHNIHVIANSLIAFDYRLELIRKIRISNEFIN